MIRNRGRGQMSVQDAGVQFPCGYTHRDPEVNDHERIPGLLGAWDVRKIYMPIADLYEIWSQIEAGNQEVEVCGFAWLRNGKHVKSKPLRLRWSDRESLTERPRP